MFRRLRAAWDYGKLYPYQDEEYSFTEDDSVNIDNFFNSGSGKKLWLKLRQDSLRMAFASLQRPGSEHTLGIAAGIGMTVSTIDSLRPFREPPH